MTDIHTTPEASPKNEDVDTATLTERLRELAKAATPGPWELPSVLNNGVYATGTAALARPERRPDAEYIAAASPDVVLGLIAHAMALAAGLVDARAQLTEGRVAELDLMAENTDLRRGAASLETRLEEALAGWDEAMDRWSNWQDRALAAEAREKALSEACDALWTVIAEIADPPTGPLRDATVWRAWAQRIAMEACAAHSRSLGGES